MPFMKLYRITSFLIALLLLLLAGCSTKKKNIINRGFHNLTAKYNVYWNGRESLREGVRSLAESHNDDYEDILEVFPTGDSETAKSVYPQMDRGIEKASIAITKHSMLIKGKEYVSTIDDAYMLIGKAHFYKHDHIQALEMFNYVIKQYKKNPIRFDGYMWLIRTQTELARFNDAEKILTKIEEEKTFPKKKVADLAAVKADHFIKKGDYHKAKDQLILAIDKTKKRKEKSRYTFILAQLYEEIDNRDSAFYYYTRTLRKNVPYEMEFNARINRALLVRESTGDIEGIKKELVKMSKDEKNIDFLDRIYFALGNIALEENDKDLALEYLKRSVAASTQNMTQKAVSYFTIADLYFEKPKYENASAYYDSSIAILPEEHKEYTRVSDMQQSLAELVKNIRIIERQDSLLRLSNMSELELEAYISDLINEAKAEAEAQRQAEADAAMQQAQLQQFNQQQQQQQGMSTSGGSGWYFYNNTALSFGSNDFRQRWGNRQLEDNWRRSSRSSSNAISDESGTGEDSTAVSDSELFNPEYYMKNIPKTDAERDSANRMVQNAYYDLGSIYKDQLSESERAIQTFEELLQKYPNGLYNLEAYYRLYRIYNELGNKPKAKYYADLILNNHPDSEYAKILRDPKYLEKLEAMRDRLGQIYDMAFENYHKGRYERVIESADSALTRFNDDEILSKFAMLKVMAIGATERLPVYRKALEEFIATYTAAPEKPRAEELLEYVKGLMGETLPDEEVEEEEEGPYVYDQTVAHYYAAVITELPDMATLKGSISNFNTRMFSVESLTIKNLKLSASEDLIFVQGFKETKKAMDYYNAIRTDQEVFEGMEPGNIKQFLISQENFATFYKEKDTDAYLEFFEENYLND